MRTIDRSTWTGIFSTI